MNGSQESMMRELQKNHFAVMDLHLYLDTHPTDKNALTVYNQYANNLKMLKDTYSKNFGALGMHDPSYKYPFDWVLTPWPWMNQMFREEEE